MNDGASGSQLHLSSMVRVRLGADRGFLFEERTGRVYSLNTTAAFVTARLQQGATLADVLAAVTATFETDRATAQRDLDRFVEQLLNEGLARLAGGTSRG